MFARVLTLAAVAVVLAGCGGRGPNPATTSPSQRIVRIDWYGHQCFRIKSALGLSILTNPFAAGSTEFSPPKGLAPDVIIISSENEQANNVDLVDNTPNILRGSVAVGTNNASGLRLQGIPVFKNPETQDVGGMNVIFRWSMDGLKFCFLGQLNTMPTPADLARLGRVDVLFMPVSGTDLTGAQRQQLLAELRPQVIIPMGSSGGVARFAAGYTAVYRLNGSAALLSRDALPAVPTILLFRTP